MMASALLVRWLRRSVVPAATVSLPPLLTQKTRNIAYAQIKMILQVMIFLTIMVAIARASTLLVAVVVIIRV